MEAHPQGTPLPLALVGWDVGTLARWGRIGNHRDKTQQQAPTPKVWGREVGELETDQGQTTTHDCWFRPGPGVPEKQGSGCISGQLQGSPLEHICKPRQGHMELLGPGGLPATIADRWDPKERTGGGR